ncbi:XRE family transcriptional regulator [Prescottella equi]|jgi:predicted site-specific integrase-resolvase|uniref:XRE family transcriptional regulator n=1 Tax=Rhodococcus hoagii TaxID=43767 RepID=UPI0025768DAD|nr:XRE family transcriptional regulator [Prescottella equi]WJJ14312.1 XRE family transcriptional regulator [Prescottella equi]
MIEYLTLHQVAGRIGVTYNTAKGYLRKGLLPEADAAIGSRLGWLDETLNDWMDTRPGRGRWGHHDTDVPR